MEKEVKKYDHNKVHVSFYYESSFIKTGDELKEYRTWINYAMQAIESFSFCFNSSQFFITSSGVSASDLSLKTCGWR